MTEQERQKQAQQVIQEQNAPQTPASVGEVPLQKAQSSVTPNNQGGGVSSSNNGQKPNKKAAAFGITALILGIVSAVFSFIPIVNNVAFFTGAIGAIFAIIALVQITKGKKGGKGITIAGLVLSIMAIIITLVMQSACSAALDSAKNTSSDGHSVTTSSNSSQELSGLTLYDKGGITVTTTGSGKEYNSPYVGIKITNNSSNNVYVKIDNVSIDNVMATCYFYEDVSAGKTANKNLTFSNYDSKTKLGNIQGEISIVNKDNYKPIDSATFTIE